MFPFANERKKSAYRFGQLFHEVQRFLAVCYRPTEEEAHRSWKDTYPFDNSDLDPAKEYHLPAKRDPSVSACMEFSAADEYLLEHRGDEAQYFFDGISFSIDDDSFSDIPKDVEVKHSLKRDRFDASAVSKAMYSLSDSLLDKSLNMSFVDKLLEHINQKGLRDSTVYKAAQIDRRLFSKIVSDRTYKPAKDTCVALILALQLNLKDAEDLLSRAGYTLSHSCKRDVILEFFIRERVYDICEINEILYRLDQKILGR